MNKPSRRSEIGEESRRRILDAAESLFAEKGFAETSVVEIAERSGISRGSIPWHFENKFGLLMAVVDRATTRSTGVRFPSGPAGIEAAVAFGGVTIREPDMAFLHTLMVEACKPGSPLHDQYVEYHVRHRELFSKWLEESPDLGVIGIDNDVLAKLIYATLIGIHVQWRVAPELVDLDVVLSALGPFLSAALAPS